MRNASNTVRYVIGLLTSACVFGFINYQHFHRLHQCDDCFFPYGLPFTIYHEGGYAGGAGFVWSGVAGDLVLTLGIGIAIGSIIKKISGDGRADIAQCEKGSFDVHVLFQHAS